MSINYDTSINYTSRKDRPKKMVVPCERRLDLTTRLLGAAIEKLVDYKNELKKRELAAIMDNQAYLAAGIIVGVALSFATYFGGTLLYSLTHPNTTEEDKTVGGIEGKVIETDSVSGLSLSSQYSAVKSSDGTYRIIERRIEEHNLLK